MNNLKTCKIDVSMLSNEGKFNVLDKLVKIGYSKRDDIWVKDCIHEVGYFIARSTPSHIGWNPISSWNNSEYRHMDVLTVDQLNHLIEEKDYLISGADAKIAWAKGQDLQVDTGSGFEDLTDNYYLAVFDRESNKFRLKPRTVKLEIEVPAPFEPKVGDYVYFICSDEAKGYAETTLEDTPMNWGFVQFGAWRNEAEIKIVVEQFRKLKLIETPK